jgi:acetyl-CoA carboxylase carboxyl transferase subunit alpha
MIVDIEKPLKDLEEKIKALKEMNLSGKVDLTREIQSLEKKALTLKKNIYENLTPWDRVHIARHPQRPTALDYIENICDSFFELRGDRRFGDDPSIVAGFALLEGHSVTVIGNQKGRDTKENITRNFGMPNPEGIRKAGRVMRLGARFDFPLITLIDTPGAYPGLEAEERGQFEAIARNIALMSHLPVPIIAIIIGEGGSGGALALGVGDRIFMLENSVYSVISPEGCASILWRDASKAPEAAEAMRMTAHDLKEMSLIDRVIPEPMGGIHIDSQAVFIRLKNEILKNLAELSKMPLSKVLKERFNRFRSIGSVSER